jgi:hypothetical protein
MKMERRFEPEPEVLERVVEILYGLLVEPPQESQPEGAAEAPCFSTECEG